ncbi:unnamed protein product [Coccothraustes coccothraustes]
MEPHAHIANPAPGAEADLKVKRGFLYRVLQHGDELPEAPRSVTASGQEERRQAHGRLPKDSAGGRLTGSESDREEGGRSGEAGAAFSPGTAMVPPRTKAEQTLPTAGHEARPGPPAAPHTRHSRLLRPGRAGTGRATYAGSATRQGRGTRSPHPARHSPTAPLQPRLPLGVKKTPPPTAL